MKITKLNPTVIDAISKFDSKIWKNELSFQRKDDAWSQKQKKLLVISVLENFYIPPILLTANNILDGLQRLTALSEFYNNKFKIDFGGKKIDYMSLDDSLKNQFISYKLIVVDIKNDDDTNLDEPTQMELFIRINENSIKLSANEKIMAKANPVMRNFVKSIAETHNLKLLSNKKKTDKRFSHSILIARCLTILQKTEDPNWGTNDVRKTIPKYMALTFSPSKLTEMQKNSIKVINAMWSIFGDDGISPKYFNVVFESIFVAFYQNIESLNAFICNQDQIKKLIQRDVMPQLRSNQMGGGTKFDGYTYVKQRLQMIKDVVSQFCVDKKRAYTQEERFILWNTAKEKSPDGKVYCEECGDEIKTFKDFAADHGLAHTKGGKTDLKNARVLHKWCNLSKGAK